ncbi:hypothetical protein BHE74_00028007 [Ensete ventricosum]|nr:hypothetical protein BHE74_00028007 [Ensete ventricosum]
MGSCLSPEGRSGGSSSTPPASPASGARRRRRSLRRQMSGLPEEQLHRIPGRMFLNGASSAASLFSRQGKKGINQDAMIVWEVRQILGGGGVWCNGSMLRFAICAFVILSDTVFCGVFDGHGPNGHMVAKKVRDILPLKLQASWEVNIGDDECKENNVSKPGSMDSEETSSVCLNEEYRASIGFKDLIKHSEIMATLTEPFLKAFRIVDKELRLHPDVDCFYSGTTAVTLVKQVDYEPLVSHLSF